MKISVILPVYNASLFISRALEQLIHQSWKDLEIILVNDGSTDNTLEVLRDYASRDSRIVVIDRPNGGPSAAQNCGLDAATGDYIHWHDHDDWVNLDFYEKAAAVIAQTSADILCTEVDEPLYSFPLFDSVRVLRDLTDKILVTQANTFNPAWRYLYRTDFLREKGLRFEEGVMNCQDYFFTRPSLVLASTVATVPGAVYHNVETYTSLGKRHKLIRRFNSTPEGLAARKRYEDFLDTHNCRELFGMKQQPSQVRRLVLAGLTLWRIDVFSRKRRHYLLGVIPVGTFRF